MAIGIQQGMGLGIHQGMAMGIHQGMVVKTVRQEQVRRFRPITSDCRRTTTVTLYPNTGMMGTAIHCMGKNVPIQPGIP